MYSNNIDIDIIDFLDLLNETLSSNFVEKWRHKYSERFIKHFQLKILEHMNKGKVLKRKRLYNHLNKKCKYSPEQINSFFVAIDIELYEPFICGPF